jgi:hypothetical protein
MTPTLFRPWRTDRPSGALLALLCAALLAPGEGLILAQETKPEAAAAPAAAEAKIPPEQLEALVAPVALYADPLLAQVLVASTYPLELMQLQQWLVKNKDLKDKALADAAGKQPWDPAIQSMAAFPDAVKRLTDDISWTTDLGNAFLAQQADVMDAVQRMRKKAQDKGALKTNEQQKVETQVVEQKTVIVVQPSDPEVIYVPSYNPTVVYPPPVYPYPPIYYPPPPPPGAAFVSFTAGVMVGAAIWGGTCCGCGWGSNNTVNVNVNNNYNRNTNINTGGNNSWQHNSQHRGGTPYSNQATASKYGGSAQGGSRQAGAQQQAARGGAGASPSANAASRGGGAGASPSASGASRGGGAGASASASTASRGGGGGASSSAFGGGSGGYSGSSAKSSSSRGSSSMSSGSRGGGGGRGGRR